MQPCVEGIKKLEFVVKIQILCIFLILISLKTDVKESKFKIAKVYTIRLQRYIVAIKMDGFPRVRILFGFLLMICTNDDIEEAHI